MNFAAIFNQEPQYLDNTEAVTLFRKTSDGNFDTGTAVANAFRITVDKDATATSKGALNRNKLDWLLWISQTGTPAVKNGDVIADSNGIRWDIWHTDIEAFGARFYCKTVQEH